MHQISIPASRFSKKSNVRRLNGYRDQPYLATSAGAVRTFLVHDSSARKSKMPHCASNHHPPYFRLISWCISSFFGFKMHSAASHRILSSLLLFDHFNPVFYVKAHAEKIQVAVSTAERSLKGDGNCRSAVWVVVVGISGCQALLKMTLPCTMIK